MDVLLYNSTVCRLCGEENENGYLLFTNEEGVQNLSELINCYLPLKVDDDGQMPRTVCPGCTIQVEATVEFLNLVIKGQKIIRELHQREIEYKKKALQGKAITENVIYELNTNGQLYQIDHPATLQAGGIDKPKRKRGRPPKKQKTAEEIAEEEAERERLIQQTVKEDTPEPGGKRRRKTPNRFREAVQGKELEKIFREEGVIDAEESDIEVKNDTKQTPKPEEAKEPEVIGLMESSGKMVEVIVVKGRKRGRPRGRIAAHSTCSICGMTFNSVGRYMSHVAAHRSNRWRTTGHTAATGDTGQQTVTTDAQIQNTTEDNKTTQDTSSTKKTENNTDPKQDTSLTETTETAAEENSENSNEKESDEPAVDVVTPMDQTEKVADPEQGEDPSGESGVKGKPKLKCNLCDKMFSNRQSKSIHMKASHAGERPYVCGVCGAAFPYPRSLTLHAARHRRADPAAGYACDLCGKVLNHPSSVVYHKEAEHAGRVYVCLKCGKGFKHRQLLQRHQLVHSQLRPFQCKLCDASFKSKPNLANHQLLHSGERRFACASCPQRFAHRTSLKLHARLHAGIKPYSCRECGKAFAQKGNLLEHARTHSGEKPYACGTCSRRFTTSSQRRLHARRHARPPPPPCPPTGRPLDHRCGLCPRAFTDRPALLRHARRHHPGSTSAVAKQKRADKQQSLLATQPSNTPEETPAEIPPTPTEDNSDERVIYVAYDGNAVGTEFHILDAEETTATWNIEPSSLEPESELPLDGQNELAACELYEEPMLIDKTDTYEAGDHYVATDHYEAGDHYVATENYELGDHYEPEDHYVATKHEAGDHEAEDHEAGDHYEVTETYVAEACEDVTQSHIAVTDEAGNPLHLTLEDGTRLSLAAGATEGNGGAAGGELLVLTSDGRRIPVEISGYGQDEDEGQPLELAGETVAHYFVV